MSPGSGLSGSGPRFSQCRDCRYGEVPESSVSIPELSALGQQWPPAVISHMGWRQKELEVMRSAAKQRFRQSRPSSCVYCGSLIKCDMYRHVACVLKEFGDPCRQRHAMPACRAATVSRIYLSDSMDSI